MRKLLMGLSLATLLSLVISSSVSPAFSQQIAVGGTLTMDMVSEPTMVDPLPTGWNSGFVGAQLFNSLMTLDNNRNVQPSLATSWSIDTQQGTYTFKLRKGVLWHDGIPFTADDVKFSFDQIISKYGLRGTFYFKNATVTIVNDETVVIKPVTFYPAVQARFLATTDTSIYPKHILQGQDFLKSSFRTTNPIGTGPFKMKTWEMGNYMELVRNENYWNKPRPYLDRIIIKFVSEPAAIIAGLTKGEIQYIFRGIPYEAVDSLKRTGSIRVVPYQRPPYLAGIWVNVRAPYVSDVKVRQAISYALDRSDIAAKATLGVSNPQQAFIDPDAVLPSPTQVIYDYNPAKANSILDGAGYKRGNDGLRFSVELLTRIGEPDEQLFAQLVKDELANVGIGVSIKTVDFATYLALNTQLKYQLATEKSASYDFSNYGYFTTEWMGKGIYSNNFNYSNPKLDNVFHDWLREADQKRQVQILQQAEDILSQDLPLIPLYTVLWVNVINNNFQGPDLPIGRWHFWDSLENTYSMGSQPTTATTTAMTQTAATPSSSIGLGPLTVGVILVLVIVAVTAIWARRRHAKT